MSGDKAASILSEDIVIVDNTRLAMRRLSFRVFTCSSNGSTLSCKSLLYVDGIPLIVIMRPAIWPNTLPDLPRRSSNESPIHDVSTNSTRPSHNRETTVALLRHQRASSSIRIRQSNKTKLRRCINNEIFTPARYMQHQCRAPLHCLERKISVSDRRHAVVD